MEAGTWNVTLITRVHVLYVYIRVSTCTYGSLRVHTGLCVYIRVSACTYGSLRVHTGLCVCGQSINITLRPLSSRSRVSTQVMTSSDRLTQIRLSSQREPRDIAIVGWYVHVWLLYGCSDGQLHDTGCIHVRDKDNTQTAVVVKPHEQQLHNHWFSCVCV